MSKDKNKGRYSTIYDISVKAGVSPITVSRVLNKSGYASEQTKKKVMDAVKELEYVPNHFAKSLRTAKTNQIILAVPYIEDLFNVSLISSIQRIVQDSEYSLILRYTECKASQEFSVAQSLLQNYADALIMVVVDINQSLLSILRTSNKPCVLICFHPYLDDGKSNTEFICVDTRTGIFKSTMHLIEQGNRKIAYIGSTQNTLEGKARLDGYLDAMKHASLSIDKNLIMLREHTEAFGLEAGNRLLSLSKLPTAICASSDVIAFGLYRAFDEHHINIPNDMSIIGMDNTSICTLLKPKLSSISIFQEQMGSYAVNLVLKKLNGENPRNEQKLFDPELIIRDSSIRR